MKTFKRWLEVFDSSGEPVKFNPPLESGDQDGFIGSFSVSGIDYEIMFTSVGGSASMWTVEFDVANSSGFERTGSGNVGKVIMTVLGGIRKFVDAIHPFVLQFEATDSGLRQFYNMLEKKIGSFLPGYTRSKFGVYVRADQ